MQTNKLLFSLAAIQILPGRERNRLLDKSQSETEHFLEELFPTACSLYYAGLTIAHLSFKKILAICTLASVFVFTPGLAQAATYMFHHDSQALNTNYNFSKTGGQYRMSTYQVDEHDLDQHFEVLQNGDGVMLKHKSTGKCLQANEIRQGGAVTVGRCNSTYATQQWRVTHLGGHVRTLQVKGTNFCLDNYNRQNEGGTHLWGCNGANPNQRWVMHDVSSKTITPTPVPQGFRHLVLASGQALNTNTGPLFDGANGSPWGPHVGLWQVVGGDQDQLFRFELQPNGYYLVRNQTLNKCLDSTSTLSNGTKAIMYPCDTNNPNQQWHPVAKGNNRFLLRRKDTDFCLDASDNHANGRHTYLWECVGNGNQVFGSTVVRTPVDPDPIPSLEHAQPPSNNLKLIRTGAGGNIPAPATKDGVESYIYYARVCNKSHEIQLNISIEAKSVGSHVKWVQPTLYAAVEYGWNLKIYPLTHSAAPKWRAAGVSAVNNGVNFQRPAHRHGTEDRRWYSWSGKWIAMSINEKSPVRIGSTVVHENGKISDLGGILEFGQIPLGECRRLEGGNIYDY